MYTIDGSVELACVGKLSLVLPLPKDEIKTLFCPYEYEEQIRSALNIAGINNIPIYVSK